MNDFPKLSPQEALPWSFRDLSDDCHHSPEGDEGAEAGMVTTGTVGIQTRVWWVPKPVLFSADRGVSTDMEGRAVPRESTCGRNTHPPPAIRLTDGWLRQGLEWDNQASERTRVAATQSSLCVLNM